MNDYRDWRTLREIDLASGSAKGAAFRCFRALEAQWRAGIDYRVLHHVEDRAAIAALRAAGRIYAGSVNVVLLGESAASQILEALRRHGSAQG
ncbi:hypothetical protein [Sinimarinibacterium thermocellulolyticum]|uniref:Uncharacterized protein n=1 Tax=Sinimarinibacterium thermocellulolyticum TaxID=3170016 RepID=A0ABV2AAG7_9GAMM